MSTAASKTIIAAVGVVTVAGIAWGVTAFTAEEDPQQNVPEGLRIEELRADAKQPEKIFDKMRSTMDREDLTDEQRQAVRKNMRTLREEMMTERMDEYYGAETEEERSVILDRQLDEFMELMEKMRAEREARRKEREANGESDDEKSRREGWRKRMQNSTREERKARSESFDPDRMARMMGYFGAMKKRAGERGIKMPWGRGHGGGGSKASGGGGKRGG